MQKKSRKDEKAGKVGETMALPRTKSTESGISQNARTLPILGEVAPNHLIDAFPLGGRAVASAQCQSTTLLLLLRPCKEGHGATSGRDAESGKGHHCCYAKTR